MPPLTGRHRLLITAGPTHEPIDSVRYIGNRSSGRLGVLLADEAARRRGPDGATDREPGRWEVTLLLGPSALQPSDAHVRVRRFLTTADLEALLGEEAPRCDALVMAAAVADYRPRAGAGGADGHEGKIKRGAGPLVIELEPTPDLLAGVSSRRREGQVLVGFALEPRVRLLESAKSKLIRKGLDLIVANPLETMDAPTIEATVLGRGGVVHQTGGAVAKESFAAMLMDLVETTLAEQTTQA